MYRKIDIINIFLIVSVGILCSCNILTKPSKVDNPVFTPPPGDYSQAQLVSINTPTEEAEIRYTLNGDDPPANSLIYTNPITIPRGTTVKAQASKPGMKSSDIVTAFYSGITPIPTISHQSGNYIAGTTVHISVHDNGLDTEFLVIRYTLNGTDPTITSAIYDDGIVLSEACTLKARTYYLNWNPSTIASVSYTTSTETVENPVISPESGNVYTGSSFSISCQTPGASIRFTTNGIDPTESSQIYVDPVVITETGELTIKAKAFKEYWNHSQTAEVTYSVTSHTVTPPVFSPASGDLLLGSSVRITCATSGSTIKFTTNGSEPNEDSQIYTSPIILDNLGIYSFKAKAYKQYYDPSSTSSASYNVYIDTPPLVYIQGGTFNNGTSDVTLSDFYIGKYEVTQLEFQLVMSNNPSHFSGNEKPIESVSWFSAIEYCNLLSIMLGLTPCYNYSTYGSNPSNWPDGWDQSINNHNEIYCTWHANGYRLATEMEWMYAARGGNQTHNYTYSGSNNVDSVAWYWGNSGYSTHSVGQKTNNEINSYDMSGNVFEWVWDIFGDYPTGNQMNPHGPDTGTYRTYRGGGWGSTESNCSVYFRMSGYPTIGGSNVGFRVCRTSR